MFSLLRDERINVASQIMYDWAHTYVVCGLVDVEFGMTMNELKRVKSPTSYETLYSVVKEFRFPKRNAVSMAKLVGAATSDSGRVQVISQWSLALPPPRCVILYDQRGDTTRHLASHRVQFGGNLRCAFTVADYSSRMRHARAAP